MKTLNFKHISLSLLSFFLLLALVPAETKAQGWYNGNWTHRKPITIDFTKVGSGPHTNFPILVSRTDNDLQARAQADGDDILFTSSDGVTKLDHDLESYTSVSGNIVTWIEIPNLSSVANTVIYMYYGNSAASSQQNISGSWDANYKGVWHLNSTFSDATTNANNGTNTGTTTANGKISGARGFVRNNGADFITVSGLLGSPTSFTTSAWANLSSADNAGAEILSIGDYVILRADESGSNRTSGIYSTSPATWTTTASGTNYAGNGWHYFVYTCDDVTNSQKLFVNGMQVAITSFAASPIFTGAGTNTFIGKHGNGSTLYDFDGSIDEVRVSNISRSPGWVLTEFNNQNSPSAFYSVGTQTSTKTFTGIGNFSDATKWTGGTLPTAGQNLIIDGTCTVDNNAVTDNLAYGSLTIGSVTGRTLNWVSGGTNRLNVTDLSNGTGMNSLNMTNGGTLVIRGLILSTASLTFISGSGTIEIRSTMTLPPMPTLNNLTINGGGNTVTLSGAMSLTGNLLLNNGILNSGNSNLNIAGNWTNNASSGAFVPGTSTVFFNSATAQSIGGSSTTIFNNLTVGSSAGIVTLNTNANVNGNLTVASGTFNLGNFTANRVTSGGSLTVSNNATLKIGGTNTYPANYSLNTLVAASTVEYAGTNQIVSSRTYGNLKLTSSSGAVVKTLPATALTIIGNLISAVGTGTSVTYTATTTVNVFGNVNIGTSTTFNGGGSFHTIGGNWTNDGTFNPSTGTISFSGSGAQVGGSSTHNFHNLGITGSSITFNNVNINVASNLTTSGSGSCSQAAGGTITMSGSGKVISGTGISLENLVIIGSVTGTNSLNIKGNLSVNGSFAGTGTITMSGASKTLSGSGTKNFSILSVAGTVTTAVDYSISSALTVAGTFTATAGTSRFTGTSNLSGTANLFNVAINGTSLQLSGNSNLGIANAMNIIAGGLNVTSFIPNTVNFNGTGSQNINAIAYYNLSLSSGNNKTAVGNIIVNRDITINTGTTFLAGSFTHSIYVDWNNFGTFNAESSTIQFLGNQTTNIIGATTFNILQVNSTSVSTSIVLQNNISAATVNMVMGMIYTQQHTITITSNRTGNGIIMGNITRNQNFVAGVPYAFEGPDNTITFSTVVGVSSITVSVAQGSVNDFPYGASISRKYDIAIPAGTYIATLRLHYENNELNGNDETQMGMWNYDGTQWVPVGKTGNNATINYVEKSGLTNITNRWTCSFDPMVVLWNGSVSNDWNTAANWTVFLGAGTAPPSANDIVVLGGIPFSNNPNISTAAQAKNLVFSSNQEVTLSLSTGGSLISGDIQGVWQGNAVHAINTNNQTITVNGNLLLGDGLSNHTIHLNVGSGTVNVNGSLTQTGNSNVTFTGAGNLKIGADYNYTSGTFTAATGTVTYNGSVYQTIAALNYHSLTVNKPSSLANITSPITVAGNLSVEAGELTVLAATTTVGDVTISAGATLQNENELRVGGNWNNEGTYDGLGINVIFNGTGTQTISATTFNNLEFNKPIGSLAILNGDVILNGNLVGTSGTLDIQSYFFNRLAVGGSASMADAATLIIGADNAPDKFASYYLAPSSTVIFNGTSEQHLLLPAVQYGNISFRNAGVKILYTPITLNGDLFIDTGATFDGGSNTITLNGNWINSGTFTPSTSTVECIGTTKNITGNTTFNHVTVTGSYVILNNVTFNGRLNITSTGSFTAGEFITTTLHGDLTNSGSLYTLGTTTFTGNVLQTLSLINATTTVALTVNFNGSVSPILYSTSAPQFGYLNINNTGGINPSVGWTILNSLNVASGASFNGGLSTHNFLGSVNNNGAMTSNGTLNFIPASTTIINFGTNFTSTGLVNFGGVGAITLAAIPVTFNDVIINKSNGTLATAATININGNFLFTNGIFAPGANINLSGNWTMNGGTFNPGLNSVVFNGVGEQTISGTPTALTFYNVLVTKTPGSLLNVNGNVTTLTLRDLTQTTGDFIAPATLNIHGNFVLSSGTFISGDNTNLAANVTNNGNFVAGLGTTTFVGAGVHTLSGSSTTIFNNLTINKGTNINSILDVQSQINIPNGALTLTNGVLKLSSASTLMPFTSDFNGGNSIIPASCGLWNNGGTILSSNMNWTVAGLLKSTGGIFNVGTSENNQLIPKSTSSIIVAGGNLNIASGISNSGVSWPFKMSSGTITLNIFGSTTSDVAPFNMDASGSAFDMSGGKIVIQDAGGSTGQNLGYNNLSMSGSGFNGGTLQIGNDSTSVSQIIGITSTNSIYNLEVNSNNVIAQLQVNDLTVKGDVILSAGEFYTNTHDIFIGNNLTNNSSPTAFDAGVDLVTMTGTISGGINGTFPITFYDLTIATSGTSVSLNPAAETFMKNVLLVTSGTLYTNDRLTLLSNSSATASVGRIAMAAELYGKLTMQRYVPPMTNYPYGSWVAVGCPVQGTTIADWDENIITSGYVGSDYPPPYSFTNIQWYDETASGVAGIGYQLVTSNLDSILSDRGYFIYMQTPTQAIDVKGNIYKHSFNSNLDYTDTGSAGDGWNLMVNQYPSEVDFRQMVLNGAGTASYYLFDSESNNFKVYNGLSQVGNAPQYISSSQSFFVQAAGSDSYLKYDETYKVNNGTLFERDTPANSYAQFKITSSNGSSDECILHFTEEATLGYEWNYDVLKMESMNPLAAECALIASDGTKLTINAIPLQPNEIIIPIYIEMPSAGTYTFEVLIANNIPAGYCLFIEDLVNGSTMPVEVGELWTINILEGYVGNRFIIHSTPTVSITTANISCYGSNDGLANVAVPDGEWNIVVYDVDGVVVHTANNDVIIEDLAAGNYQLELSDALLVCNATTVEFSIAEPVEITAELLSSTTDQCNNSLNATVEWIVYNMDNQYSYSVFNSEGDLVIDGISLDPTVLLENLHGDVYTINIDNGCGVMTIVENVNDLNEVNSEILSNDITLTMDELTNPQVSIEQESFNASSSEWILNGEFMGNDQTWTHTFNEVGEFILILNSANEFCSSSDSITILIDHALAIDESGTRALITTTQKLDELIFTFNSSISENISITLFDLTGKIIWNTVTQAVKGVQISVNLNSFAKGVYVARAEADGIEVMNLKFMSR